MIDNIPVIGIIGTYSNVIKKYYIAYSFVKWLQNQGCHIIYINPTFDIKILEIIFKNIDGLIIPGGDDHPTEDCMTYIKSKILLDMAVKHGNFPVLGICMGLQYMLTYYSGLSWDNIKTVVMNHKDVHALQLVTRAENTILENIPYNYFPKKIFNSNHDHAISLEKFLDSDKLNSMFNILSYTNYMNIPCISTVESKMYPFFGFQWHPEKPGYEWSELQGIHRSPESMICGNIVAQNFINKCKHTIHTTSQEFLDKYNVMNLKQFVFKSKVLVAMNYDEPLVVYLIED